MKIQASRRKYHYIYKTTCLVNGKYYIGMHSTENLDDGYLGSGTLLQRSIRKYGIQNFKLEILEHYFTRQDLAAREKELVNEECLKDEMCMNLAIGGDGSFHHLNSNSEIQRKKNAKAQITLAKLYKDKNSDWSKNRKSKIVDTLKNNYATGLTIPTGWSKSATEKSNSPEARAKRIETFRANGYQQGIKNAMYNKRWINNGTENFLVNLAEIEEKLALGFKLKKCKIQSMVSIV